MDIIFGQDPTIYKDVNTEPITENGISQIIHLARLSELSLKQKGIDIKKDQHYQKEARLNQYSSFNAGSYQKSDNAPQNGFTEQQKENMKSISHEGKRLTDSDIKRMEKQNSNFNDGSLLPKMMIQI
jgi:hypothetical protein